MNSPIWILVFWLAAALVLYAYFGYPTWLWLRSRWRARPVHKRAFNPFISVVMVVRDEALILEAKLRNLTSLNYPADKMEIIVVSDGSRDGTASILDKHRDDPRIKFVLNSVCRGKAAGLNDGIALARGEIVVFTDPRQIVDRDALSHLLENFSDPDIGCVSGNLLLGSPSSEMPRRGLGLYWGLDKKMWELESTSGSTVGVTGAFYAARRALLPAVPAETILDDLYIPMHIVRQGKRVILESRAQAWDTSEFAPAVEWKRKVRTLTGNYQLLKLQPSLLASTNPIRFEFISHRLLKLAIPFLLAAILLASIVLQHPVYRLALIAQLTFYGVTLLNFAPWKNSAIVRLAHSAFIFVLMNAAAAAALVNFLMGRRVAWKS